jgi:hypothetical protein
MATKKKESNTMAEALSDDFIAGLLATSRQRGVYDAELKGILESGAKGVKISLTDGAFAGKKATSVKTGFENARKKLAEGKDSVRVVLHEEQVYVINTNADAA